jgi:predicted transcriptional regulator
MMPEDKHSRMTHRELMGHAIDDMIQRDLIRAAQRRAVAKAAQRGRLLEPHELLEQILEDAHQHESPPPNAAQG